MGYNTIFTLKIATFASERRRLPISRVVYRGYNNANSNGGVSYMNANNDASNANANIGSRLENKTKIGVQQRGRVRKAEPRGTNHGNSAMMRKAGKTSVGQSLVGRKRLEEVGPGEMKAHGKGKPVRRDGNIIAEITDYGNMSEAFDTVLRGAARKRCRAGRFLLAHREECLKEYAGSIRRGWPEPVDYHETVITDAGKERRIQVISMRDRIKANAVMNVVDRHLKPRFIRTTSASIKGRGMHDLMAYIRRDMEEDAEGTQYCYKFDISKFYESVRQDTVMRCVRRVFKDECLIAILQKLVGLMPHGLSIGLRSSQGLGNLLLSEHLDHYLKDTCGVRHFYRYCDDGVVLAGSKAEL